MGNLENRPQSGRPSSKANYVYMVQSDMEDLKASTSMGSLSAREIERRILELSIRHVLHGMLDLYPYKIQVLHQLLPADTCERQNFAPKAMAKKEHNPQWLLNVMWIDEAHFSLHGKVNMQNTRFWVTSNSGEYRSQPLSSPHVPVWCSFTGSFILGPFFFLRYLSCVRQENLYSHCRTVFYAFA